jgi:hypothetical protein
MVNNILKLFNNVYAFVCAVCSKYGGVTFLISVLLIDCTLNGPPETIKLYDFIFGLCITIFVEPVRRTIVQ